MPAKIDRGNALSSLTLAPLIDVVFLLLIFFLVASRLSQEDRELDIPLPSAANAMPMTAEPQELLVNVDQLGTYSVNGQTVDETDLEQIILQAVTDNPLNQSVIIRADRRVPLQAPVTVMDVCLRCGAGYSLSIADEES